MKYVWAVIAGAIAIFWLIVFWEPIMELVSTANSTYPTGDTAFLQEGIRATPLLLWGGIIVLPIVAFAVIAWKRRRGGG